MNTRKVNARLRQSEALRLRAKGASYREIARKLHYAGPSGAFRSVAAALASVQHEGVAELRSLHSLRLCELISSLWGGRKDPQTARAILACLEREAKLYGADAPSELRILDSPQWAKVKAVVVEALAEFPDARAKVAEVLRGLHDD